MTLRDLLALWSSRDYKYARLRYVLDSRARESVKAWRRKEAEGLSDAEKLIAHRVIARW